MSSPHYKSGVRDEPGAVDILPPDRSSIQSVAPTLGRGYRSEGIIRLGDDAGL